MGRGWRGGAKVQKGWGYYERGEGPEHIGEERREDVAGRCFFYLSKLRLICNQKKKNNNLITSAEPLLASICE